MMPLAYRGPPRHGLGHQTPRGRRRRAAAQHRAQNFAAPAHRALGVLRVLRNEAGLGQRPLRKPRNLLSNRQHVGGRHGAPKLGGEPQRVLARDGADAEERRVDVRRRLDARADRRIEQVLRAARSAPHSSCSALRTRLRLWEHARPASRSDSYSRTTAGALALRAASACRLSIVAPGVACRPAAEEEEVAEVAEKAEVGGGRAAAKTRGRAAVQRRCGWAERKRATEGGGGRRADGGAAAAQAAK